MHMTNRVKKPKRDKNLESVSNQSNVIADDFAIFKCTILRKAKYLFSNTRNYFLQCFFKAF